MNVLWHWQCMGPYHFARMNALARSPGMRLTVVETASLDDHGWIRRSGDQKLSVITLSTEPKSKRTAKSARDALKRTLEDCKPDVLISAGYAEPHSLSTMLAYRHTHAEKLVLLWSESTAMDRPHSWSREAMKALLIPAFDGALVAGNPHAAYVRDYGLPWNRIGIVGNCVDNDFFRIRSDEERRLPNASVDLPQSFFVFVARMIPEKNAGRLIEAFRLYRNRASANPWDLVLVGGGPEEAVLRNKVKEENITGVRFAGLRQIDELPRYYGRAKCLVLPSVSEPWGLVVNEAMASGLPLLVSSCSGCVADLVCDGVNGFVFDPSNVESIAGALLKMSGGSVPLDQFGQASRRIIARYTPELFAERVINHIHGLYAHKIAYRKAGVRTVARMMTSLWAQIS